jgi:FkbM family methyltransferase
MNVVDLGCMTYDAHREDESTMTLIDRFRPDVYWGFDPHPAQQEYDGYAGSRSPQARTIVRRAAAWTHEGTIGLTVPPAVLNPLRTSTVLDSPTELVRCFDLAAFLDEMPEPVILKMDVEGAEHTLLRHLVATGAIEKVRLLLVEFHGPYTGPPVTVPCEVWA